MTRLTGKQAKAILEYISTLERFAEYGGQYGTRDSPSYDEEDRKTHGILARGIEALSDISRKERNL